MITDNAQKIKNLRQQFNKAWEDKASWDWSYMRVYQMTMPTKDSFFKDNNLTSEPQTTNLKLLFTSAGVIGAKDFINSFMKIITTNKENKFILNLENFYETEDITDEDNPEMNEFMEYLTKYVTRSLLLSNFYESAETLAAQAVAGSAVMLRQPKNGKVQYTNIPQKDIAITDGPDGKTRGFFRKFKIKRCQIKWQWADLIGKDKVIDGIETTESNKNEEIELKECCVYNYDTDKWEYTVSTDKEFLIEREYNYSPFVVYHGSKRPDCSYSSGVGLDALPEILRLNLLSYHNLFGTIMRASPMWAVTNTKLFDPSKFKIKPNIAIPVGSNDKVEPLQAGDMPQLTYQDIQTSTMDIKQMMNGNTLPNDDRRDLTAAEIYSRNAQLNRSLGEVQNHIFTFMRDIVKGEILIAMQMGMIPLGTLEPKDLDKIQITIRGLDIPDSDLVQNIFNLMQSYAQFGILEQAINLPKALEIINKATLLPAGIGRTAEEIEEFMSQQAQAQMEAEQLGQQNQLDYELAKSAAEKRIENGEYFQESLNE